MRRMGESETESVVAAPDPVGWKRKMRLFGAACWLGEAVVVAVYWLRAVGGDSSSCRGDALARDEENERDEKWNSLSL